MSIPGTGLVIIIITIYSIFFKKDLLYKCIIFFLPFTATAVLNIGSEGEGSAIQPYMFLGSIWLIIFLPQYITFNLSFTKREVTSIFLILIFSLVAVISLYMPVSISGTDFANRTGKFEDLEPIFFSTKNITQFLYLLLGILFSIAILIYNRNPSNLKKTIKIYANSVLFVIGWGILELIIKTLGLTYPNAIFNNSYSASAGGYMGTLNEIGMERISSVAVEPSILVQSILIILPFFLSAILDNIPIYSRKFDITYTIVLSLFIFRTTSTTGIICLVATYIIFFVFYFKRASLYKKLIATIGFLILVPIVTFLFYFLFSEIINTVLFDKADSYSSLERGSAIIGAWEVFLRHPILGTGWGSVTSFDLFIRLLSNTGIVGTLIFSFFLYNILRTQIKNPNKNYIRSGSRRSILCSFIILIFSNIISGFSFTFGYFWMTIGLAMISGSKFKNLDENIKNYR